jgi:hypothetical protein
MMIPTFLEKLKQGSNVVEEMNANVRGPATLLFARHVEALLREFTAQDRSSWNDVEDEYWTIFTCNRDGAEKYVSVFVGWMMRQHETISRVWLAVGGEGLFWNCDLCRPARQGESAELLSRLRALVECASQKANDNILYSFDVVTRIDGSQPVLPPLAFRLGESLLVSIPRDADADKLGWGHNNGLAVLIKVPGADAKDAEQAVGKNVFEFLLFWTLISGSYCHPTKLLFSSKSSDNDAELRMMDISITEANVKKYHWATRVDSKTALELAEPLWRHLQNLSAEMKTKILSSLAAYRAAQGVQRGIHFVPTLAVVGYFASLESLVASPVQCEGNVTCGKCGALSLKHEKTGHLKSILEALLPTLSENRRPEVKAMLKHAYHKLRSAYVHSAQTEWREFAGKHLWQDITDSDEFWREQRPFITLFKLDEIVRDFIICRISAEC